MRPDSHPGRLRRATEAHRSAADAIGPIPAGLALFLMTRGQFGMLDMIRHILDTLGPANLSIWTWCVADHDVEILSALMSDRRILSGRLIVDRSAERRSPTTIDAWRDRFGLESVRVCKNHSKIARIWTDDRRVLLRGSMNLNYNPRFEQADITEGGPEFDLVSTLEHGLPVLERQCSNAAAETASGIGKAFELSELTMFDQTHLKPWTP